MKTDDSPTVVVSGSVDDAIKKVKEKLDAIDKESSPSDEPEGASKHSNSIYKKLDSLAKQDKDAKLDGQKVKMEQDVKKVIVTRQLDENRKLSPEQKAEIEKVASQVKKLADELRSKQKELQDAKHKLARLWASTNRNVTVTLGADAHLKARR